MEHQYESASGETLICGDEGVLCPDCGAEEAAMWLGKYRQHKKKRELDSLNKEGLQESHKFCARFEGGAYNGQM